MWASQNGHVEMVDKLLQHGATVDLQDKVMSQSAHKQKSNVIINPWRACTARVTYHTCFKNVNH